MSLVNWIIIICALLVAGWLVVDGARALIVGEYVTPKSGKFAGQLGPWSKIVTKVGIEPRSTEMKLIFLIYGIVWLGLIVSYFLQISWSWWGMLVAAVLSLWYIPFGTILGLVQIVLLIVIRSKINQ